MFEFIRKKQFLSNNKVKIVLIVWIILTIFTFFVFSIISGDMRKKEQNRIEWELEKEAEGR